MASLGPLLIGHNRWCWMCHANHSEASFNFNLSGVSRPFVVDVVPSNGTLKPEEKLKARHGGHRLEGQLNVDLMDDLKEDLMSSDNIHQHSSAIINSHLVYTHIG